MIDSFVDRWVGRQAGRQTRRQSCFALSTSPDASAHTIVHADTKPLLSGCDLLQGYEA